LFEAGDEAEKSRFAGAAFTEESEEFAGSDLQEDILKDGARVETLGDVAEFQQGPAVCRGGSGSRRRIGRSASH
jgi:hypothetical protein